MRGEVANELKARELDLREARDMVEIKKIMAQAVQVGVQSAFSAMQGAAQVAANPAIAPVADMLMAASGYQPPNPAGVDPNLVPEGELAGLAAAAPALPAPEMPGVNKNTSPVFPPVPSDGASPMQGIETPSQGDNLPA